LNLNPEQQAAVDSDALTSVVVAGPGSGKSRTIIARIARLVNNPPGANHVGPFTAAARLVVITYTNAAAHVIAERLAALGIVVGYVGTLHGYCMRLIQAHGGLIGYRAGSVSIVPEDVREELLLEAKKKLGSKISDTALLEFGKPKERPLTLQQRHDAKLVFERVPPHAQTAEHGRLRPDTRGRPQADYQSARPAKCGGATGRGSAGLGTDRLGLLRHDAWVEIHRRRLQTSASLAFRGADPTCLLNMVNTGEKLETRRSLSRPTTGATNTSARPLTG
jgi:hypothetical protein